MSISGHTSSYNHILAPICSYLQMLLHCPFFLLRIYEFSNLASDTQTWSFTWAKEIFILTPHTVSRWYLLLPAEPALLAEGAHSCKAGSRLVNIQGPASLHSCIWAPQPSPGLQLKAPALHVTTPCRFELWKASLPLTLHQERKPIHLLSACTYELFLIQLKQELNTTTCHLTYLSIYCPFSSLLSFFKALRAPKCTRLPFLYGGIFFPVFLAHT